MVIILLSGRLEAWAGSPTRSPGRAGTPAAVEGGAARWAWQAVYTLRLLAPPEEGRGVMGGARKLGDAGGFELTRLGAARHARGLVAPDGGGGGGPRAP